MEDLLALVRDEIGEDARLLTRDSAHTVARTARRRTARRGPGPGGGGPCSAVAAARGSCTPITCCRRSAGARWRPRAPRARGVVLHLHQYRLVCAIGVCFRDGHECMECHGTRTWPAVRHDCRGSHAESLTYAASLALWQRRLVAQADVVVVPSTFAGARLRRARRSDPPTDGGSQRRRRAGAGAPSDSASRRAGRLPAGAGKGRQHRDRRLRPGSTSRSPSPARGPSGRHWRPARAALAARSASWGRSPLPSWPACVPRRQSRSLPSRSAETFGLARRRGRWPPDCRSPPLVSARCPSSSPLPGLPHRATPRRSPW